MANATEHGPRRSCWQKRTTPRTIERGKILMPRASQNKRIHGFRAPSRQVLGRSPGRSHPIDGRPFSAPPYDTSSKSAILPTHAMRTEGGEGRQSSIRDTTPESSQTFWVCARDRESTNARKTHASSASTSSSMSGSAHCRLFMFRRVLGSPHTIISALKLIACDRQSKR